MNENKITALAVHLGCENFEIEYNDRYDEFYTSEGTFRVMDEDEADNAHLKYTEQLIDDMGIGAFAENFQRDIMSNYLEQDWFKECCEESYQCYAENIESENSSVYSDCANRLIEECMDACIIDEDEIDEDGEYTGDLDLAEEYTQYLTERVEKDYDGNFSQWYLNEYGDESMAQVLKNNPYLLDVKQISDAMIECDGYGHSLASWDGYTNEENGFYIFKESDRDERDGNYELCLDGDGAVLREDGSILLDKYNNYLDDMIERVERTNDYEVEISSDEVVILIKDNNLYLWAVNEDDENIDLKTETVKDTDITLVPLTGDERIELDDIIAEVGAEQVKNNRAVERE